MASPRVSLHLMQEALDAFAQHGNNETSAAFALGIPRGTLQGRLRAARLYGSKASEVTPPDIPSSDEPVADLWQRRIEEHKRRRAAQAAREWMRFTVTTPGPFGLAFVGDPHVDDDGCDLERLSADLDLIETTPSLYGVGMGDWINAWTRKLGHLYAHQGTSESQAWQMMAAVVERPLWMLLLLGNHDLWHGAANPVRWMATSAPIENWAANFEVASSDGAAAWRVSAAHDFPGHSMWNKGHGPLKRAMMTGANADLYVAGDKHCWTLAENEEEHSGRRYWAARVRGYKMLDAYASQLGYAAQRNGHTMVAVCDPVDRSMVCFSDVEKGAKYLTWLRIARGFKPRINVRAA